MSGKIKVVILCHALKAGGGISVGQNFAAALKHAMPNSDFWITVPKGLGYENFIGDSRCDFFVFEQRSYMQQWYFENISLPKLVKAENPNLVIALANRALPGSLCPQLMLLHDPHLFYPSRFYAGESIKRKALKAFQRFTLGRDLPKLTALMVQTATAEQRVRQQFDFTGRVVQLPNAISTKVAIDQKNVIISNLLREHETYENLDVDYPTKLTALKRINGGGNVILGDAFSSNSRMDFIAMALDKLKESDIEKGAFRGAFFKSIEVFRGSDSFIDVNYYLLFSALESLSRFHLDDYTSKNCSTPIAKFLEPFGFNISQDNTRELVKSVSTYTHIRNALFHNGKFECEVNINGRMERISISKYYSQFNMLIPLIMLKYIGFDDGHINWNCWIDRMRFK